MGSEKKRNCSADYLTATMKAKTVDWKIQGGWQGNDTVGM
jgi:hypothetical protein